MIKTYTIISFFVCVLLAGTCAAYQLIGTEALSEELVAQHYTINLNLDAVIVVDRTTPTFEYQTYYSAGSADEEEGEQGRLHFLEHLMAGLGGHEYGKPDQIVSKNDGQSNASTSYHFMRFILRFPKDKFDLAVEIDRDRYYNTVINEKVVKKEKKIILTEKSRSTTNTSKRLANYCFSLIYKKKNYNGLGHEAFIKQIEPVDLKAYYENFLRLQKRLIVVIGDVEVNHVLTKLDEAYGNEQISGELSSKLPVSPFPNPEILGKKFRITSKHLSVAKFNKIWYTPSLGHRDYAGLHILTRILNKPSNSLKSSMIGSKLVSDFNAELIQLKGFGLMVCLADLPHNTSVDALETAIQTKLKKIKKQGITKDELNEARNHQLHTLYSKFYNPSSMAYSFGRAFVHTNDPFLYPKLIKDLKSISVEDIPRIIDQYLTNENSIAVSLTLPTKEKLSAQEKPTQRTSLYYGIMVLVLAGFVLLVGWAIRKLRSPERLSSNE